MDKKLESITQEDIQAAINLEALDHAPKTVRNMHGLLSAVFNTYRPDFRISTDLPKKVRPKIYVPSDAEIQALMNYVKGTEMELPILLAAFGPMRRGEICALSSGDINGNIVHVQKNMVLDEDNNWVTKAPKSYAGDRYIEYPAFVAEKWAGISGRITSLYPSQVTNRFVKILKRAGLQHFRFHDLRHYSASIQHALGIPDSYIMQRGGWGNDGVLKSVYRHVMDDKMQEMNDKANQHFTELCNTDCNTK
jgi:integrase